MRNEKFLGINLLKSSTKEIAKNILIENFNNNISDNNFDRVYWGINPAYLYRGIKYYPEYINALKNSKNVYVDGQSILFVYNFFRKKENKIKERSSTTDLFPLILKLN